MTPNVPPPPSAPRAESCQDGDACDADGVVNNVCTFEVGVCVNDTDARLPQCAPPPGGIVSYAVKNAPPGHSRHDPELDVLQSTVQVILPSQQNVCSQVVPLTIPLRRTSTSQTKIIHGIASPLTGATDRDRLRLICAPAPSAGDWPTYGFDLRRERFNPAGGLNRNTAARLKVRWFFPTGGAVTASPAVADGVVYVGSWDGNLYALDARAGTLKWPPFNINDPHPDDRSGFPGIQSSAAVAAGKVYFGAADAKVYALDAQTGAFAWSTPLGDPARAAEGAHVWSSPAVFDGKVYVGKSSHFDFPCVRGEVVALDAATGHEVWRFDVLPEKICANNHQRPCTADADCGAGSCIPFAVCRTGTGSQPQNQLCASDADCTAPATCQRPLGGGVTSSPTIDPTRGVVYVSTGDCVGSGAAGFANSLLALDGQTGALLWSFQALPVGDLEDFDFIATPNLFTATISGTPRRLVGAGNKNGVYYALDQETGALVWQKLVSPGTPNLLGGFNASPGVAFGKIYAGVFSGPPFIFAIDATNGNPVWSCPDAECNKFSFGPPGIGNGVVLIGDSAGLLRAFEADTGAVLKTLALSGGISSGPAIVNGMVFVGAGTGGFGTSTRQGVYGLSS